MNALNQVAQSHQSSLDFDAPEFFLLTGSVPAVGRPIHWYVNGLENVCDLTDFGFQLKSYLPLAGQLQSRIQELFVILSSYFPRVFFEVNNPCEANIIFFSNQEMEGQAYLHWIRNISDNFWPPYAKRRAFIEIASTDDLPSRIGLLRLIYTAMGINAPSPWISDEYCKKFPKYVFCEQAHLYSLPISPDVAEALKRLNYTISDVGKKRIQAVQRVRITPEQESKALFIVLGVMAVLAVSYYFFSRYKMKQKHQIEKASAVSVLSSSIFCYRVAKAKKEQSMRDAAKSHAALRKSR